MADETAKMPGVYVDLDELIALEHRGGRVSFLPHQPVRSLLSGRFASRMRGRGLNFDRREFNDFCAEAVEQRGERAGRALHGASSRRYLR